MADDHPADDATDGNDRLRAAFAHLPSLFATWRNGELDPQALNDWLVQIGEIDPPADGEGDLTAPA